MKPLVVPYMYNQNFLLKSIIVFITDILLGPAKKLLFHREHLYKMNTLIIIWATETLYIGQ